MSFSPSGREGPIADRLREVEEAFERQMRERGFEPDQAELVALPGPLAKLYVEREELRATLESLKSDPRSTNEPQYERDREN